jgi:hypothetical protein
MIRFLDPTSFLTLRKIIPSLIDLFNHASEPSVKSGIQFGLSTLIETACRMLQSNEEHHPLDETLSKENIERLFVLLIEGIQSSHEELKGSGLRALQSLYQSNLLSDDQVGHKEWT